MLVEKISTSRLPRSRRELEDLLHRTGRVGPVLFRGAAGDWPAMAWCPEYFRAHHGRSMVCVQVREHLTMEKTGAVRAAYEQVTLADYLDSVERDPETCGYLTQTALFELAPSLRDDCRFPPFPPWLLLSRMNLWLGPRGTKSKLHYDSDHNLFAQIHGRKVVTLVAPEHSAACYPINVTWYDGYSPIDVFQPDLRAYPEFANVTVFRDTIGPGDILFIPKRWWHDIRSLDTSISVNLWWVTPSEFLQELVHEAHHGILRFFNKAQAVERKNSYLYSMKQNLLSLYLKAMRQRASNT
ncbi:MAG TPA: cupin-like domain-containing protein [Kofleriaceae bacterium]|jgi:lysine-specific demethylase 8